MKFLAILALFAAIFVMAQANEHEIKKATNHAHTILKKIEKEKNEVNHENHGHLLVLVEYYENLVKKWLEVLEDRSPIPFHWNDDQQNLVENALKYMETCVTEEMKTVKEYIHKNQHFSGDIKHLVEHVNQTLEKANHVLQQLKHNHHSNWAQVEELTSIIHILYNANAQLSHSQEGTDRRKNIEKVEYLQQSMMKTLQRHGHREFFF